VGEETVPEQPETVFKVRHEGTKDRDELVQQVHVGVQDRAEEEEGSDNRIVTCAR
jgi:hypothetical protein